MRDAIIVQNLGKRFNRYDAGKPITLMEAALAGLRQMQPVSQFWALRHVNFIVAPGEMLGVIGRNGAGKSTLLQLIGGVGHPTEGRVQVNGRIGALLDLGAGFHGDLTGRENVFVTAISAGLTRREVTRRFSSIVEFAELEKFIDNPVRTYSTGMQMRLAFSVAVHTDPDVLLVDEFLSVGDISFQKKCLNHITDLKRQGCAIVLISHDAEQVEQLCDRALWIRQGQVVAYGEPVVVAGQYVSEMRLQTLKRTPVRPPLLTDSGVKLEINENRFGSLDIEITDVKLLPTAEIESGDALCVEIEYYAPQLVDSPIFGVTISREDGHVCLDVNTSTSSIAIPKVQGEGRIKLRLNRLDLSRGRYFINVGAYEQNWEYVYDYHWHIYSLLVSSTVQSKGSLYPPHLWEVSDLQTPVFKNRFSNF